MPNDEFETLVNAKKVAEYLGVSREFVYRVADREDLPSYMVGGATRFRLSEVEAWLRTRRRGRSLG